MANNIEYFESEIKKYEMELDFYNVKIETAEKELENATAFSKIEMDSWKTLCDEWNNKLSEYVETEVSAERREDVIGIYKEAESKISELVSEKKNLLAQKVKLASELEGMSGKKGKAIKEKVTGITAELKKLSDSIEAVEKQSEHDVYIINETLEDIIKAKTDEYKENNPMPEKPADRVSDIQQKLDDAQNNKELFIRNNKNKLKELNESLRYAKYGNMRAFADLSSTDERRRSTARIKILIYDYMKKNKPYTVTDFEKYLNTELNEGITLLNISKTVREMYTIDGLVERADKNGNAYFYRR